MDRWINGHLFQLHKTFCKIYYIKNRILLLLDKKLSYLGLQTIDSGRYSFSIVPLTHVPEITALESECLWATKISKQFYRRLDKN